MNRLYLAAGALLLIVALSFTSCTLYKGKIAASVKADIATKVVTGAVAASKKQVVRDYQAQSKKAMALDSVRASTQKLRNFTEPKDYNATQKPEEAAPVAGTSDPWIGVFNDAVRRTNGAISDSVDMP